MKALDSGVLQPLWESHFPRRPGEHFLEAGGGEDTQDSNNMTNSEEISLG